MGTMYVLYFASSSCVIVIFMLLELDYRFEDLLQFY
jgi:hypothetical protein